MERGRRSTSLGTLPKGRAKRGRHLSAGHAPLRSCLGQWEAPERDALQGCLSLFLFPPLFRFGNATRHKAPPTPLSLFLSTSSEFRNQFFFFGLWIDLKARSRLGDELLCVAGAEIREVSLLPPQAEYVAFQKRRVCRDSPCITEKR